MADSGFRRLLLTEGLAIGAVGLSGVYLVGAHHNVIQGAVILAAAVVGALLNGAFDGLVCMAIHDHNLLLFGFCLSMAGKIGLIQGIFSTARTFCAIFCTPAPPCRGQPFGKGTTGVFWKEIISKL